MPQVAIVMPKMSMTMTEGELLTWHVTVGQVIHAGDVVCEVATDKVDMEVEATASGTVVSLLGNPGDVIEVGTPLLMVESEEDDLLAGIFDTPVEEPTREVAEIQVQVPDTPRTTSRESASIQATPKARAVARENDVDLNAVSPSRPSGVITHLDVLESDVSESVATVDFAARLKTRLAIARALQSSAAIPAFSLTFETTSLALAEDEVDRLVMIAEAWTATMKTHPHLHVKWEDASSHMFEDVVIAVSVMSDKGVVTPAISGSANRDELLSVLESAKKAKISLDHLRPSTTAISDLSDFDIVAANSILVSPQSSALTLCSRKSVIRFSITADHRIADPADVAQLAKTFIGHLKR
ncbi:MAG: hypothetical protein RIS09_522 [Actinomycetota bacterium]